MTSKVQVPGWFLGAMVPIVAAITGSGVALFADSRARTIVEEHEIEPHRSTQRLIEQNAKAIEGLIVVQSFNSSIIQKAEEDARNNREALIRIEAQLKSSTDTD